VLVVARKAGSRGNLRLLSRALFAVSLAALAALIVRLRGSGGTPPHTGGWRELSVSDLEPAPAHSQLDAAPANTEPAEKA